MRRDRPLHRPVAAGRSLARTWIIVAMALVALVNIFYMWPVRIGLGPTKRATSSGVARVRVQARKELADLKAALGDGLPRPVIHLHCADQSAACEQQRYNGRCSSHLLDGFHICLGSCGVCPALELALQRSMNLTSEQLVVVRQPGPPPCEDSAEWCSRLGLVDCAAAGAGSVAGICKASCGACLKSESLRTSAGDAGTATATAIVKPNGGGGGGGGASSRMAVESCFDAADMCSWWAQNDPRICERAAEDLTAWWWVAVACRRSCGLCGRSSDGSGSGGGTKPAPAATTSTTTAALVAAARLGVQVGEAADGSPNVAVFESISDEQGACTDTQGQCPTWAAAGECTRNPGFMEGACPVSCGACPVLINLRQPLAKIRLNNGVLQPSVGYGCAGLGDSTTTTIRWALEAGYRHLDSAQAREWYREDLVGAAMNDFLDMPREKGAVTVANGGGNGGRSGGGVLRRGDIFVTSKLHPRHLGYKTTLQQFNATLRDLRSSYVDMFLLHYAECWGDLCGGKVPEGTFLDSWRALEELYEAGLIRAIGVSNFSPEQLSKLLASARVRPAVLQVHVDPLGRNEALQALCRREGITLTAYSTLGTQWNSGIGNPVLGHPILKTIGLEAGGSVGAAAGGGKGEGKSAAQVALRWALQQGLVVLPRSSNQGRIRQNLELYDWGLSAAHMRLIAHLRPA